jgi:RNA polymerase sigma-70 factor (ECF subfamily)
MHTTPVSLLERLKAPADEAAWRRFVDLYTPLLCQWGRRAGLSEEDLADLIQDVFATLVRVLPDFQYDCQRSFRSWLKTVLMNRLRNQISARRATVVIGSLDEIAAPEFPEPLSDAEYRGLIVRQALRVMQDAFEPATWQAAKMCLVDGRSAREVAAETGLSINSVYLAKSRVLKRLRQELDGLLDQ